MAKDRLYPWKRPLLSLRMVEWSLLAGLILVLTLIFVHQMRVLQGQAELSAVKTTLGALRTAFVLDHLHNEVAARTSPVGLAQHNPFELLQRHPVNYRGEMTPAEAAAAPAGSWVFDPVCTCVGYLPMHAQWFDSPSGDVMAWYRVTGASGPLQLTAKENYVWQGQVLN